MDVRYKVKTGTHSKQSNQREIDIYNLFRRDGHHPQTHEKKGRKRRDSALFALLRDKQEIGGDQKKQRELISRPTDLETTL